MANDQMDYDIEVYTCRLCGHVEFVSSEIGNRPTLCPRCRIEGSFVMIDIRPKADPASVG